jgi:hypothetical protein
MRQSAGSSSRVRPGFLLGVVTASAACIFAGTKGHTENPRLMLVDLILLLALLWLWHPVAAWCVRRLRGKRWARQGRCAACGYDLRGSGEVCPECGTCRSSARRGD